MPIINPNLLRKSLRKFRIPILDWAILDTVLIFDFIYL